MAELLGRAVVLVDPNGGPAAVAAALVAAAGTSSCDLVVLLDVGGDVLAHGDEPGLASPLADAVLLAAAPHLARGPDRARRRLRRRLRRRADAREVLERLAEVAAAGGDLGARSRPAAASTGSRRPSAAVPTEASAHGAALRARASAATRRSAAAAAASSSPPPAAARLVRPAAALARPARLAAAVADARVAGEADERSSTALGVRTELAYERERAPRRPQAPRGALDRDAVARDFRRAPRRAATRDDVARVLALLEGTRERLAARFPRCPGELDVVLHPARGRARARRSRCLPVLRAARPRPPRGATWPAGRRARELHVLAPRVLRERASNVAGSREMLLLTPAALYAQLAVAAANPALPPPLRPARCAATCAGRGCARARRSGSRARRAHARPAIARRLREGRAAGVPARPRATPRCSAARVFDLLAREEGERGRRRLALEPPRRPARARSSAPSAAARSCTREGAVARAPGARWPGR